MTKITVLDNIAAQLANLVRLQLAEIEAGHVDMSGYVIATDPGVVPQSDGSFVVCVVKPSQMTVVGPFVATTSGTVTWAGPLPPVNEDNPGELRTSKPRKAKVND